MLLISVFSTMADELWTTFRSPPPASGCLAVDGKYIWCGTDYGAFRYDSVTGDMSHYTVDDGLIDNTVNAIAPGPDGVIWFATNIGISRFDGSSWKSFTRNDIISAIFYDITVDSDNTVWVASSGGIVTFNGEEWRLIEKGAFSCINAGSNGVVWALSLIHI